MRTRRSIFACAAGVATLAAPAAEAATYHVQAGESSRKGAPPPAIQNRFMPGTVQVHAGDTVEWMGGVTAPHTVTFLKGRNLAAHGFVVPDPRAAIYAEVARRRGRAVRLRRSAEAGLQRRRPAADRRRGGVASARVQSTGLFGPEFGRATASFRFPKAGVYRYNCLLHPGMQGTVVVKPKGDCRSRRRRP